ncbi:ankyrin repeat domain-containing protein [Wolbachia endosymbiont of Brugia pahangi]|uniref:ankyrin repeat domain-containing protein n=1 Tax=Wolbachia endosymbiont of Brugia pahangi TaxID=96495 RepID=UPI001435EC7F|nr:ankyrin repeat domain-containing protein [Wolbachia endosymbiont of Brugia pahangi]QIT35701.1 ankyrin repeat family protein [Wolbachia endosymbiont of Brugia pahangi]
MEYEQWKEILSAIDKETDLSKDNVIAKIKEKLKALDSSTYEEWKETNFDINHLFAVKYGLLHLAVHNNLKNVVNALFGVEGIDVNAVDKDKHTSLHLAVEKGHIGIVNSLLEVKADVNVEDENGKTPLYTAVQFGCKGEIGVLIGKMMIGALIRAGANVNAEDKDKCTPLHFAARCGRKEIVQTLIEAGANVNAANEDKRTPSHIATQFCRKEIVKVLVEAGADVRAADKYGITPLHFADGAETVKTLIGAGANVNVVDKDKRTPLHWVKGAETAETLIEAGVNVNAIDKGKRNPLHMAVRCSCEGVIKTLIGKRADLLSKNNDSKIPSNFNKSHYIIRRVKSLWSEERMKRLDQQSKVSFVVFGLTILFGTATATTLFVTETIAFGPYPIIGTVVIVAAAAWVVSCAADKILEPSTKIDEMKAVQVDENMQKAPLNLST